MKLSTPFGFHSTADEVLQGVDLSGRRAVVTGASSGIGIETARALARAGAEVTLAVRRRDAGDSAANTIRTSLPFARIDVAVLDLEDLGSVNRFGAEWSGPLHILVNNAGIMALPQLERTSKGWERQFATNFLGHFALTLSLRGALRSGANARVVFLSSSANMFAPVFFDDPHFQFIPYDPFLAYGQSKTALALAAVAFTQHWVGYGITANALNPGAIATNLQKYTGGLKTPRERQKSIAQGAATSVLLAASPLLSGIGGRYFEDCNEAQIVQQRPGNFGGGVAPYAVDVNNAERLWALGHRLLAEAGMPNL